MKVFSKAADSTQPLLLALKTVTRRLNRVPLGRRPTPRAFQS